MTRIRAEPADVVFSCNACGSTDLNRRAWREGGVRVTNDDCLRCGECGHECGLADVVERPTARRVVVVDGGSE